MYECSRFFFFFFFVLLFVGGRQVLVPSCSLLCCPFPFPSRGVLIFCCPESVAFFFDFNFDADNPPPLMYAFHVFFMSGRICSSCAQR